MEAAEFVASPQLWLDGEKIRLKAAYAYKDTCRSVNGARWDPHQKTWTYPATPTVAGALHAAFAALGPYQATQEFLDLSARAQEQEAARSFKGRTDLDPVPGVHALEPWLHQQQAFWFSASMDAAMLGIGMGGGKSKVAIDLIEYARAKRVLIICPNTVVKVWPKEFVGNALEGKLGHQQRDWQVFDGLRRNRKGALVQTSAKARAELFADAYDKATDEYPVAVVVNYEAAHQGQLRIFLSSVEWDYVILDESHRIKSPGGVQSTFVASLRAKAKRRLCLTGTMMPHSPLDIYAQYRFLDPGVFGTSYARFRNTYAVMGGYQGKQVLGMNDHAAADLADKIGKLAYIISNEELDDVLGLPEAKFLPMRTFALSAKARVAYDQLLNDFVTQVDEGTVAVNNALTQLLRLQQITSGHLPSEKPCPSCQGEGCDVCDGVGYYGDLVEVDTGKRDALADWMADLPQDEPVVVACRFIHDLDSVRWVAEKQGRKYGELSGRNSSGLTEQATMSREIDVLGVQIQSGGVGIDLTRARYAANFSVGFSNGDFRQWLKRVHRPGQKRRTYYVNFAAEQTLDFAVFASLEAKEDVVRNVIAAAKRGDLQ